MVAVCRDLTAQEQRTIQGAATALEGFLAVLDGRPDTTLSPASAQKIWYRANRGKVRPRQTHPVGWRDPAVREVLTGPLDDGAASQVISRLARQLVSTQQVQMARRRLQATGDPGPSRVVPLTEPVLAVLRDQNLSSPGAARAIGLLTGRTPTAGRICQLRRMLGP